MPSRLYPNRLRQAGFTIVELMVATLVFSVILIILTTGIIRVTQMYYKGITLINTQNVARNIMDTISQSIQYSGGSIGWPTTPDANYAGRGCIGSQEYDYQLGSLLADGGNQTGEWQSPYGLALTSSVSGCAVLPAGHGSTASPPASGYTELLSPHMRLANLSIESLSPPLDPADPNPSSSDNLYQVQVTVVYGDYSLLCLASRDGGMGGCNASNPPEQSTDPQFKAFLTNPLLSCREDSGAEYCAVSSLSTVVQRRLAPET